jgi:uncharacterized protein (TIGR03067 family)
MRRLLVTIVGVLALTSAARSGGGQDDAKKMEGTWAPVTAEASGKEFPEEIRKTIKLVLTGGKYVVTVGKETDEGTCKVDSTKKPKTLDITGVKGPNQGKTILAIYELTGDTLRVCYDLSGKGRPTEFKTTTDSPLFLVTYRREKS